MALLKAANALIDFSWATVRAPCAASKSEAFERENHRLLGSVGPGSKRIQPAASGSPCCLARTGSKHLGEMVSKAVASRRVSTIPRYYEKLAPITSVL